MATVNIFVTLETSQNPPVILDDSAGKSARSVTAANGDTIKWQKKDNNDRFDIVGLAPTGAGEAFSTPSPGGSGQNLTSTFNPPAGDPSGTDYPYTLTVKAEDGTEYTTTEKDEDPDNGRPVIRN